MSRHLITVEVDTDRDSLGQRLSGVTDDVEGFASTFGAGPGAQWETPPYTCVLSIEELSERRRASHDFVQLVDVAERHDALYAFNDPSAARRFAAAINDSADDKERAVVSELPINGGGAAERLLAAERGDILEDLGWADIAERVREGEPLLRVIAHLKLGEADDRALMTVRNWDAIDSEAK